MLSTRDQKDGYSCVVVRQTPRYQQPTHTLAPGLRLDGQASGVTAHMKCYLMRRRNQHRFFSFLQRAPLLAFLLHETGLVTLPTGGYDVCVCLSAEGECVPYSTSQLFG